MNSPMDISDDYILSVIPLINLTYNTFLGNKKGIPAFFFIFFYFLISTCNFIDIHQQKQ
jgi:hypothetical protein